ncbi:c-type cytochrome [Thiolapillus brandeum]|uniref:Cytochrome c, class I n=1 Tax=Thiolapillus brandeum TaxID=1076588 RepID=A0A7U6JIY5_9GAMM|nr:c-type cytochrome [Thiolapillus brandeum]BAO45741.1 cytochrome c, class I [Thiolapillus brandeum]
MKKALLIASFIAMAATGVAQAAGDAAAGKTKSAACAACHGADGNSGVNPLWPKLAGQHPKYIMKQLHDFKAGKRKDATMAPMAAPLNDQDMENLAAYFSSQTRTIGEAAKDKVAQGEKLYRAGSSNGAPACSGCHGPAGGGNAAANFPSLGGQSADYVAKQLKAFRDGTRSNDMNGMMAGVAAKLSDAEIAAVSQYVQGLH